jgi:hypothetical protein
MEMGFTEDDIREWKKEGWKFRVKTVKGKRYITRRKGKEEKGLGRHRDVLWKLIENTSIGPTRSELRREGMELVEGLMTQLRASYMSLYCIHVIEGFCSYWRFRDKPGFFNIVDDRIGEGYYRQVEAGKESSFWVFKAVNFYCINCPAFGNKQMHAEFHL